MAIAVRAVEWDQCGAACEGRGDAGHRAFNEYYLSVEHQATL